MKLNARREFLLYARNAIGETDDRSMCREHVTYSQLCPYLSQRSIEQVEPNTVTIQMGGRGSGIGNSNPYIYDDIHALEKKWVLL